MLPALIIFIIFIGIPAAEIAGFVYIGGAIGIIPTIILTILTAIAGTYLLRLQGLSVLRNAMADFSQGIIPAGELIHGVFILVGALFLLIPGFFTDAFGLLLFISPVRVVVGRLIIKGLIPERAKVYEESADDFHQVVIELDHKESNSEDEKSSTWGEDDESNSQTEKRKEQ